MIKKHLIALFMDTSGPGSSAPAWKRIKKSTELTISMNPETEEVDYIADENATEELTGYKPSINQPLKMIKDEPDFEYFWNLYYNMATGSDAKTKCLVVFMFDKTGTGASATYKAWEVDATVSFNELNAVASELTFDLLFGGTVRKGTCTATGTAPDYVPAFTETTEDGIAETTGSEETV